jgi:16S rRNA (guanine527-N7)-methyltransferase
VPTSGDEPGALAPPLAEAVFGERVLLATRYAQLLRTDGVDRGLLGPRETQRLWERHLCNCAVLTDLLPRRARIVDVGSGAGLPGLALAIRRPDLHVDLVDSLQRRTDFLDEAVTGLGLAGAVTVVRGRAEDPAVRRHVGAADWVTARAVAPLDRLVRWCQPLLRPGGQLLAMKGARAEAELSTHHEAIRRAGGVDPQVVHCGAPPLDHPVTVVQVRRGTPDYARVGARVPGGRVSGGRAGEQIPGAERRGRRGGR